MKITTAGESHGKGLFAIIEGLPAGLKVDPGYIDAQLTRRQSGYGRGGRQSIESDRVEILSGVRNLTTLGSPITLAVWNRDFENWKEYMAPEGCDTSSRRLTQVRPGHADLAGMQKFETTDARNILERASARETAARVAAGAVCAGLLQELGIEVRSFVRSIGTVSDERDYSFEDIARKTQKLSMLNASLEEQAVKLIDECASAGETVGGVIELRVQGLKSGFGSCMTYQEKLDSRIGGALFSVQAVKGVEFGLGFEVSRRTGSAAHDEIFMTDGGLRRVTNRAGGIEGGMSNGEELIVRAAMKPIPTLRKGLRTVDTDTGLPAISAKERGDTCAVPACAVVLESVLAAELCAVVLERLGGDTLSQVVERYGRLS